jgi:NADPH:quinone reductase-like Zn-dependent oxidoreductase
MRALVYHGPGVKAWEDVPKPEVIADTDAIVRVDATTICGTDLHILKGDVPAVTRADPVIGRLLAGLAAAGGQRVVRPALVDVRRVLGQFSLDLGLQIDTRHTGEAEQADRRIRQFFANIRAALTPFVECFGNFCLEQAELQWDISGIEPFC